MTDCVILQRKTFSSLSQKEQSSLRDLQSLVLQLYNDDEQDASFTWPISTIYDNRSQLAATLHQCGQRINTINPASFRYLKNSKKDALRKELLFAFYFFCAQHQLNEVEHHRNQLAIRFDQIEKTANLLYELEHSNEDLEPQTALNRQISRSHNFLKFLGLTLGREIADEVVGTISNPPPPTLDINKLSHSHTEYHINWMGAFNDRRMYWVWGEGFISSVLALLPDYLGRKQQAIDTLNLPKPTLGYISWILYYTRFGIELGLLLKHTIKGPWMREEEAQIPTWERFKTQWHHRKFAMLNDSVWATVNLITFFWWVGSGRKGYYGDMLTAVLLVFDLSMTFWKFSEEIALYNQEIDAFNDDIESLEIKIRHSVNQTEKENLEAQLKQLRKQKAKCEFDWRYKKYHLINDVAYALGLVVGFAVMCNALFPPATFSAATSAMLGAIGGGACFVMTLAYQAITGALEIHKTQVERDEALDECDQLLTLFKSEDNDDKKKLLFLDRQQLMQSFEHSQQLIQYQKANLVRSILIDALFPALVFTSLMFAPLGIGLSTIAVGIAIAYFTKKVVDTYKPQDKALPNFDEAAFEQFERDSKLEALQSSPEERVSSNTAGFGLFTSRGEDTLKSDSYSTSTHDSQQALPKGTPGLGT